MTKRANYFCSGLAAEKELCVCFWGLGEKLTTASPSKPADDIYPKMMSGRAIGLNGEAGELEWESVSFTMGRFCRRNLGELFATVLMSWERVEKGRGENRKRIFLFEYRMRWA